MEVTKEEVRKMLDASGGLSPKLFEMFHEQHRKRNHEIAKRTQPETLTVFHVDDLARIRFECRKPSTEEEKQPGGFDYLCQTVRDTLEDGDTGDIIHALIRVWRKAWAMQQHLGPIEGTHGVLR